MYFGKEKWWRNAFWHFKQDVLPSKKKTCWNLQKIRRKWWKQALLENFKFSVPTKVAIQFKIKLRLSKSKYNSLRTTLEDYIRLPCYDTFMAEAKFMMPTKEDHPLLKDHVLNVLNNKLRPVDIRFIILCSKIMFWMF